MILTGSPKVSIIIPNYNGMNYLKNLLPCFKNQSYNNFEIIIIDDNSSDKSVVNFIKTDFKEAKLIENEKNIGFAASCNKGIKNSNGKYVCLLNNDTIVKPNFVEEHVQAMEQDEAIGILGCKILDINNRIWFSGVVLHTGFPYQLIDDIQAIRQTECATFCAVFIRRVMFNLVGLISEDYFMKYEDADFCQKVLKLTNYKISVLPNALVIHIGIHGSMTNITQNYHHYRSLVVFQRKYYPKCVLKNICVITLRDLLIKIKVFFIKIIKFDGYNAKKQIEAINAMLKGTIDGILLYIKK